MIRLEYNPHFYNILFGRCDEVTEYEHSRVRLPIIHRTVSFHALC